MAQMVLFCVVFIFVSFVGCVKNGEICASRADCEKGGHCALYFNVAKDTHERRCCSTYPYSYEPKPNTNADCCGNSHCNVMSPKPFDNLALETNLSSPCPAGQSCAYHVQQKGDGWDGSRMMRQGCYSNKSCLSRKCFPNADAIMQGEFTMSCCNFFDDEDGLCGTDGPSCCNNRDCNAAKNGKCVPSTRTRKDGAVCNLDSQCNSKMCRRSPTGSAEPGGSNWKLCCSKDKTGQACTDNSNCCYDNMCDKDTKKCRQRKTGEICWNKDGGGKVWSEPDICEARLCGRVVDGSTYCCMLNGGGSCYPGNDKQCCDANEICHDELGICVKGRR